MRRPWVTSHSYEAAINLIVEARKSAGLSQRDLAERLEKPRSFVSKLENRERRLDIVEFVAVTRALGIEPAEMMSNLAATLTDKLDF
jgi:transcriptional regulator with XRE-family HTH domain